MDDPLATQSDPDAVTGGKKRWSCGLTFTALGAVQTVGLFWPSSQPHFDWLVMPPKEETGVTFGRLLPGFIVLGVGVCLLSYDWFKRASRRGER